MTTGEISQVIEREQIAHASSEVPEWARMPLEHLLNEELLEILHQAIWSLPEKYQIVVILRDIEEFSTEDTAQIISISPATVKVRPASGELVPERQAERIFRP